MSCGLEARPGRASRRSRALARRHGLQLYNIDHRTWTHSPRRAEEAFLARSLDERWLEPSPEQLADRFVRAAAERLPLILDDLAGLADAPGAIVEGPQLIPSLIAPYIARRDQILVLVPSEARQRATLTERGSMSGTSDPERATANLHRRNVLLAALLERQAREHGLQTLRPDGGLAATIELAENALGAALSRVPRGGDLAAVRSFENDALATQARLYRASGEAPPGSPLLAFACECGRSGCTDVVELTLEAYDAAAARPLLA
jgi:hypothetical protein